MNNDPNKIILHHSLTEDGKVLSSYEAIRRYHMEELGFSDIAYHGLFEYVDNQFIFQQGRDWQTKGAHTSEEGQNYKSLGWCIVGNFDRSYLTVEQIQFILMKQAEWEVRLNRKLPFELHRTYADYKTCPGTNISLEVFSNKTYEDQIDEVMESPVQWKAYVAELIKLAEGDTGILKQGIYLPEFIDKLYKA